VSRQQSAVSRRRSEPAGEQARTRNITRLLSSSHSGPPKVCLQREAGRIFLICSRLAEGRTLSRWAANRAPQPLVFPPGTQSPVSSASARSSKKAPLRVRSSAIGGASTSPPEPPLIVRRFSFLPPQFAPLSCQVRLHSATVSGRTDQTVLPRNRMEMPPSRVNTLNLYLNFGPAHFGACR